MEKDLINKLQGLTFAEDFKRGKKWKGYNVYEPIYKEEYTGGFPKIVLEKDGEARISTHEECFAYMDFIKSKEKK